MKKPKKLLYCCFLLLTVSSTQNSFGIDVEIPAHVDLKFSTTMNVVKRTFTTENVGATEFVFLMNDFIYKTLEQQNNATLQIDDIKIIAPSLTGNENVTFSFTMAYRADMATPASEILAVGPISSAAMKTGSYSTTKPNPGWSTLNATILSDLTSAGTHQLDNVFFTIKIRVDGVDNALIDLNKLDLQIDIYAKAETMVSTKNP